MFKRLTQKMTVKGLLFCLVLAVIVFAGVALYGGEAAAYSIPILIGMAVTAQKSTQETRRTTVPLVKHRGMNTTAERRYFTLTSHRTGPVMLIQPLTLLHCPPER